MQLPPNITKFTIRVYGILQDNEQRVLVSDEYIRGDYFTKFPGGGMELGEGTRDCLKREFMEETGLDVTVGAHIYTTDYFQVSAFKNTDQIVSIYYFVQPNNMEALAGLPIKTTPFDFTPAQVADPMGQSEVLRWLSWNEFTANAVSLPIDKIVVNMLKTATV